LLEVLDKGKAASVTIIAQTKDKSSGKVIFENQSTVFIRGSGGFGGKKKGSGGLMNEFTLLLLSSRKVTSADRGPASAPNVPPKRNADAIVEEKTSPSQAALYR
jgi:hypothetical protein